MQVLFFGSLGERLGKTATVELPSGGCTIANIRQALMEQNPDTASYLSASSAHAAVNHTIVQENFPVTSDQEVAFFPALSGG